MKTENTLVSVVMPCLNEEEAIGICIDTIKEVFSKANINGEIVVCDNGSTDNSVNIAKSKGVCIVHQPIKGYGNAYIKGFANAKGKYLVMADADSTYDFNLIPEFLNKITNEGYDFVTGSRYLSDTGSEHISLSHRFLGNPMLTAILNYLFSVKYTDVYCGYRAFTRKAYECIQPVSPGMEFNLELAINAWKAGLKITEIPIELAPRKGKSKLRTVRDGWRSLRMMLLYCPNKVFLWPGFLLLSMGMATHLIALLGVLKWDGRQLGSVTGIFATIFSVIGFQILTLGLYAKTYSWSRRFDSKNIMLQRFYKYFKLEIGLMLGAGMVLGSALILVYHIILWLRSGLKPLLHPEWVAFAATIIILGFSIIFSSLFVSAMSIKKK